MELTEAYRECERITWTQARNFAYGIRLLPAAKRRGLAVIYAFARRIDDIGDGTLPAEEKIAALEAARRAVLDLSSPDPADPVLLALADTGRIFPVPMAAFGELIDGCVADVRGTHYETFEDLLYYCRCVAGSIGRLSLGIFGTRHDLAGGRAAGRLARRRPAADEHPARYPRGLPERAGLPARGRPGQIRLRPCLPRGDDPPAPRPGGSSFKTPAAWSSSRPNGPGTGTPPACGCCRCSITAVRPAPAPWRAFTGSCSNGSRRSPPRYCAAGCRCRPGRRPRSRSRPWPGGSDERRPACPRGDEPHGILRGRRVVVIGGGLAGITAAIALAESGADVTLLEARPRLGGATCSFNRDGLIVDTGQHVFLGCCSAYRGLLARLGMTEHAPLQDRFDVTVLAPGRSASEPRQARLRRTALPGPLHMLPALGPVPVSFPGRTDVGGSPGAFDAPRRPGRPGGGHAAVRRLASCARTERADPPGAVGPVLRLVPEHRGRRRLAGAGRHRGENRPARQEQRGGHRRPGPPARRTARRRGERPC